jgi:RimJ/RimL family protein N-acetyltransferase
MKLVKNRKRKLYGYKCDCYDILINQNKIGTVGLFFIQNKACFDTYILPKYRRKGYALQAKKSLIKHSDLQKIYSYVDKNNIASINLQFKMGSKIIEKIGDKFLFVWEKKDDT